MPKSLDESRDAEGEHVKEVYAYFGLTFYQANVLETGLALAVLHLDFMVATVRRLNRGGAPSFDRAAYEAAFDAFMDTQHALTLGSLIRRFRAVAAVPDELVSQLSACKAKRDHLAHHFWRDRAEEFMTQAGREAMVSELNEAHAMFLAADRAVDDFVRPSRHAIGLTDVGFERHYAQFRASLGLVDD